MYDKKALHKGGNVAKDDEEFLAANTNPWKASASGQGYSAKYRDDTGWKRGECGYSSDDGAGQNNWDSEANTAAFMKPSQSETDYELPHEKLAGLIQELSTL